MKRVAGTVRHIMDTVRTYVGTGTKRVKRRTQNSKTGFIAEIENEYDSHLTERLLRHNVNRYWLTVLARYSRQKVKSPSSTAYPYSTPVPMVQYLPVRLLTDCNERTVRTGSLVGVSVV
jgi:hypothetical protein